MVGMQLRGKTAIVTGAAQGIGLAIAQRYAAEGARVVVADIAGELAKEVASAIDGTAVGMGLDVTSEQSIEATLEQAEKVFGPADILVNNAAVFSMGPLLELDREQYRKVFSVNVEGLLFMLQATARQMVKFQIKGKIINMASQAGRRGEPLVSIYCASKAAVISITQSAGLALIQDGINVNGISPGVVDTPMWDVVDAQFARYEGLKPGEKKKAVGLAVPFGRMGQPDDLTGAAVFLASSDADYVVAQTLNVDGGNWMS